MNDWTSHIRARRRARALATSALWSCLMTVTACELPGIPSALDPEPPAPDMREDEPDLDPAIICTPGARRCVGANVVECNASGTTEELTLCAIDETCREGTCADATETCADDVEIALSRSKLYFDINSDLKPSSQTLELTNCTSDVLRIQKADLVSALRRDGSQVFDFSPSSHILPGTELLPGDSVSVLVDFRPRDTESLESGSLYLNFDGGTDPITREVEFSSSTWCLSAPPQLDLGELELAEPRRFDVPILNCGSRALLISGANLALRAGESDSVLIGADRPISLPPGGQHTFNATLTPTRLGKLEGELFLSLNPDDSRRLTTPVEGVPFHGIVANRALGECADEVIPPATIKTFQGVEVEALAPIRLHYIELAPGSAPESWLTRFESRSLVTNSHPLLLNVQLDQERWFIPRTQGAHEFAMTLYSPRGVPTCQTSRTTIESSSQTPYYIELEWSSPQDPIPLDTGPGQGIDLDLHARFVSTGDTSTSWNTPTSDCNAATPGLCATNRGVVFNSSRTGALPESVGVLATDTLEHVDVGVYVKNRGAFLTACAKVRVWKGDELLVQFPDPEQDRTSAQCPGAIALQNVDSFLYLGRLDPQQGTFDDSEQRRVARGFPSD